MSSTATPTADVTTDATDAATTTAWPDTPYYRHPDMRLGLEWGIGLLIMLLPTLCIALRLYVRRYITNSMGVDDFILIAAYLGYIILPPTLIAQAIYTARNDASLVLWRVAILGIIWGLLSKAVIALVRCAIAAFILRAVPKYEYRIHRIIIVVFAIACSILAILVGFLDVFQCGTDPLVDLEYSDNCIDQNVMDNLTIAMRATVVSTDWIMVILPGHIIWKSAMPLRVKIPAILILMIGASGSIVDVFGMVFNDLGQVYGPNSLPGLFLFHFIGVVENCFGIMAISLAATRPLFDKTLARGPHLVVKGQCQNEAFSKELSTGTLQSKKALNGNVFFLSEFQAPSA